MIVGSAVVSELPHAAAAVRLTVWRDADEVVGDQAERRRRCRRWLDVGVVGPLRSCAPIVGRTMMSLAAAIVSGLEYVPLT